MDAIIIDHLSKIYSGDKKAVNNISLTLKPGEVFGFLGPNGAGKTTTIKILNGMLMPSEGSCRVLDINPIEEPAKAHAICGIVTEHAQMYDHLTGLQNLIFYGSVFGISSGECKEYAESLLDQLELTDAKHKKLAAYSTGMRQRLSLARSMIHQPKILFLDEPTSGLDPESVQSVNNLIHSLAQDNGMTIFLCTHQLRYAQEICTSYGLLHEGSMIASGDLDKLCAMIGPNITLQIKASEIPISLPHKKIGEQQYEMSIESEEEIPSIVKRIVEEGGDVYQVLTQKLTLEDIYFALTAKGREEKK